MLLCLLFGVGIGLLMALLFWRDDASQDAQTDALFAEKAAGRAADHRHARSPPRRTSWPTTGLSMPGLVIDEKVVSSGRIPTQAEIRQWLGA